jgi:hypothetical protein
MRLTENRVTESLAPDLNSAGIPNLSKLDSLIDTPMAANFYFSTKKSRRTRSSFGTGRYSGLTSTGTFGRRGYRA